MSWPLNDTENTRDVFATSILLWLKWVFANIVGWVICLIIVFAAALWHFKVDPSMTLIPNTTPFYSEPISTILVVGIVATLMGTALGFMQWLAIRQQKISFAPWLISTGLGWLFGITSGLAIGDWITNNGYSRTDFVDEAVLGCAIGLFSGMLQWLVLHRRVAYSRWWIVTNTIGWSIAILVSYKGDLLPLFTVGTIPGALTGLLIIKNQT